MAAGGSTKKDGARDGGRRAGSGGRPAKAPGKKTSGGKISQGKSADGAAKGAAGQRKGGNAFDKVLTGIIAVCLCLALYLLGAPVVLNAVRSLGNMQSMLSSMSSSSYDASKSAEAQEQYEQALAYNDKLSGYDAGVDVRPYEDQLTLDGDVMAYVVIPKISLRLPVYHGTSSAVLGAGVGHIEQTSLPAGAGASGTAHCALSAHSGMTTGLSMFDNIRDLDTGDRFYIVVCGRTLAYQVYNIETIEATKTRELSDAVSLQEERDLVTLVTCTPIGVNTHRLMVHAERIDYVPSEEELTGVSPTSAMAKRLADDLGLIWRAARSTPTFPFLVALLAGLAGYGVYRSVKRRRSLDARRRRWLRETFGKHPAWKWYVMDSRGKLLPYGF